MAVSALGAVAVPLSMLFGADALAYRLRDSEAALAIVDEGAVLGDGCRVWHFVHISAGARIGRGCSFGQNVYVGNDVRIGDHVKIQNNVSVYEGVTLEDDVFCGPSMVFTNVMNPRSAFPRDRETGFLPTLVKRGATIGANATIVCGVTIGEHAFIGAGSVVTRDVPAYAEVYGAASFYKAFSLKPRGRHVVQVCMGTACHVRGAQRIVEDRTSVV
jgi:UDP-2-acetamido-3-amino-2,3-dideoxy-glucuronate N-acetyltransferase